MSFDLYPYNFYILYASLVLLLLFLIILAVKAARMAKAVSREKKIIDDAKQKVQLAEIKMEAMKEKKAEDDHKNRYLKPLIPILLGAYHIYHDDPQLHGVKGYLGASRQFLMNKVNRSSILKQLKEMFGF